MADHLLAQAAVFAMLHQLVEGRDEGIDGFARLLGALIETSTLDDRVVPLDEMSLEARFHGVILVFRSFVEKLWRMSSASPPIS